VDLHSPLRGPVRPQRRRLLHKLRLRRQLRREGGRQLLADQLLLHRGEAGKGAAAQQRGYELNLRRFDLLLQRRSGRQRRRCRRGGDCGGGACSLGRWARQHS
jgi:hypothetical protein